MYDEIICQVGNQQVKASLTDDRKAKAYSDFSELENQQFAKEYCGFELDFSDQLEIPPLDYIIEDQCADVTAMGATDSSDGASKGGILFTGCAAQTTYEISWIKDESSKVVKSYHCNASCEPGDAVCLGMEWHLIKDDVESLETGRQAYVDFMELPSQKLAEKYCFFNMTVSQSSQFDFQ